MADIIQISKFSSLDFNSEWKHHFESNEAYRQVFSRDDIIRVQFSVTDDLIYTITLSGDDETTITPEEIGLTASGDKIYQFVFTALDYGCYAVQFSNEEDEIFATANFSILEKERLVDTSLLRYTHRLNDYDVIFVDGETPVYFDYRFEGGILFGETKFNVSSNSFRDQRESNRILSAYPYKVETLTIGDNNGVPIWVAEKVNLIFCLSDVRLNNEYYTRSEGSTPEIGETIEGYPLYVFKMEVERVVNYNNELNVFPFVRNVLATEDYKMIITEDGYGIRL